MDTSNYRTMMEALADVRDPRARRGVRFSWGLLLGLVGAAIVAGNRHGRRVAAWVREHTEALVELLEPEGGTLPSESTLRRTLALVSVSELEGRRCRSAQIDNKRGYSVVRQWMASRCEGAGRTDGGGHLLGVARHGDGAVLAQVEVGTKENEIVAAPELLKRLELGGTVTTMDAMLTQRMIAQQILGQGGHYLMVVKDNQPSMRTGYSGVVRGGSWMPSEIGTRYWKYESGTRQVREAYIGVQHSARRLAAMAWGR